MTSDRTRERLAQALMDATAPLEIAHGDVREVPILCLDPDFNELPEREHMGPDDDYCQEDILALVDAVLAEQAAIAKEAQP